MFVYWKVAVKRQTAIRPFSRIFLQFQVSSGIWIESWYCIKLDVEAWHQCDLIPLSQVYAICLGVNEQNPKKRHQWNKLTLLEETVLAWGLRLPYFLWTMAIYSIIWFRDRSKAIHCKLLGFARIWRLVPRNFLTLETDSQVSTQEFSSEKCRCRNTMLKSYTNFDHPKQFPLSNSCEKLRQAFGPEGDQWLCGKQWEKKHGSTLLAQISQEAAMPAISCLKSSHVAASGKFFPTLLEPSFPKSYQLTDWFSFAIFCHWSCIMNASSWEGLWVKGQTRSNVPEGFACKNCCPSTVFFRFASTNVVSETESAFAFASLWRERGCVIMICLLMPPRDKHQKMNQNKF